MTNLFNQSDIEAAAKAICEASGQTWREGEYEALTGPKFTMETHPLDPLNNHWRHKATAALTAATASLEKRQAMRDGIAYRGRAMGMRECATLLEALRDPDLNGCIYLFRRQADKLQPPTPSKGGENE